MSSFTISQRVCRGSTRNESRMARAKDGVDVCATSMEESAEVASKPPLQRFPTLRRYKVHTGVI